MILRPSHLYNENPHTRKDRLYMRRGLNEMSISSIVLWQNCLCHNWTSQHWKSFQGFIFNPSNDSDGYFVNASTLFIDTLMGVDIRIYAKNVEFHIWVTRLREFFFYNHTLSFLNGNTGLSTLLNIWPLPVHTMAIFGKHRRQSIDCLFFSYPIYEQYEAYSDAVNFYRTKWNHPKTAD